MGNNEVITQENRFLEAGMPQIPQNPSQNEYDNEYSSNLPKYSSGVSDQDDDNVARFGKSLVLVPLFVLEMVTYATWEVNIIQTCIGYLVTNLWSLFGLIFPSTIGSTTSSIW